MLKKFTNKKGFTLMEMLIVVAIIAVLCSLGLALTGLILVFASGRPSQHRTPARRP